MSMCGLLLEQSSIARITYFWTIEFIFSWYSWPVGSRADCRARSRAASNSDSMAEDMVVNEPNKQSIAAAVANVSARIDLTRKR